VLFYIYGGEMIYYLITRTKYKFCLVTRYLIVKLIVLFLLLTSASVLDAQNILYVNLKDNSQTEYLLSGISKMTFNNGNLLLEQKDGQTNDYSLVSLRNLMFNELISVHDLNYASSEHLFLYPNPSDDFIIIENNSSEVLYSKIEIYDNEGKIIISKQITPLSKEMQTRIDISSLLSGAYVCRILSEDKVLTKKFIKK
jgi:hypothetical protein